MQIAEGICTVPSSMNPVSAAHQKASVRCKRPSCIKGCRNSRRGGWPTTMNATYLDLAAEADPRSCYQEATRIPPFSFSGPTAVSCRYPRSGNQKQDKHLWICSWTFSQALFVSLCARRVGVGVGEEGERELESTCCTPRHYSLRLTCFYIPSNGGYRQEHSQSNG